MIGPAPPSLSNRTDKLLNKEGVRQVAYGEEACFYLGNLHVLSTLRVLVVSAGSWMWAIAWAQVGAKEIGCCPLHEDAAEDLLNCMLWLPSLEWCTVESLVVGSYDVICVQVAKDQQEPLPSALSAARLLVCVGAQRQVARVMSGWDRAD
jgi:hypothetical protein